MSMDGDEDVANIEPVNLRARAKNAKVSKKWMSHIAIRVV